MEDEAETALYLSAASLAISTALSLLRPEPSAPIALLALYGAHAKSHLALRAYALYAPLTLAVDAVWLYHYSALQLFTLEQLHMMNRREQIAVALTAVNMLYTLIVVAVALRLAALIADQQRSSSADEAPAVAARGALATPSSSVARQPFCSGSLASMDSAASRANAQHLLNMH